MSHLCFSYRYRMPLCVCTQFVQLSPPSIFPSLPPPPSSLSLSLSLSHTHTHTHTHKPCSLVWGWSYRKNPRKEVVFKVPIRSRLVGAWLETGLGRGGDFFAGGSQPVFVWKLGTGPVPAQRIAWPPAQWWIWLSFPYPQWGSRQATKRVGSRKTEPSLGKR